MSFITLEWIFYLESRKKSLDKKQKFEVIFISAKDPLGQYQAKSIREILSLIIFVMTRSDNNIASLSSSTTGENVFCAQSKGLFCIFSDHTDDYELPIFYNEDSNKICTRENEEFTDYRWGISYFIPKQMFMSPDKFAETIERIFCHGLAEDFINIPQNKTKFGID